MAFQVDFGDGPKEYLTCVDIEKLNKGRGIPVEALIGVASTAQTSDPGCENPVLVSTGGAFPRDPNTLVVRWTGFSNYEIAYKGDVLLLVPLVFQADVIQQPYQERGSA